MWNNRNEYSRKDEKGRWINTEFPPESYERYPSYSGYRTPNREYLFYQFAVQYYDVLIEYKGTKYILVADEDGCSVVSETWIELSDNYSTANDLSRSLDPKMVKDYSTLLIIKISKYILIKEEMI